jgi:hypothetical protein
MNKNYLTPQQRVVELRSNLHLLAGSDVDNINGNAGLNYRGGGSGPARSRSCDDDWDDDEWETDD